MRKDIKNNSKHNEKKIIYLKNILLDGMNIPIIMLILI